MSSLSTLAGPFRRRVALQLGASFGLLILVVLVIAGFAVLQLYDLQDEFRRVVIDNGGQANAAGRMRDAVQAQGIALRDAVLQEDLSQKRKELNLMKEMRKRYVKASEDLGKRVSDPALKAQLVELRELQDKAAAAASVALDFSLADEHAKAAEEVRERVRPLQAELASKLDGMEKQVERLSEQRVAGAEARVNQTAAVVAVGSALLVVLGTIGSVLIARRIGRRLLSASNAMKSLAAGDLTVEVPVQGEDELAQLLVGINETMRRLRRVIGDIRTSVDSVSTASNEIAQGNADLSSRTEQQASNLQQTAASMEQMTSSVKQNTDAARQANQLAGAAAEVAAKGGVVVGQVVSTMGEIQAQSRKIADIINVIDGIAFQTNILALNAAVEAARAGEQGRGFAVVAGEVRNLAQRSAQAAREIKSLISNSVERVDSGSRLVNDAGTTMGEIVAQVKRVTDLIGEMTAATVEQASGISQVNQAVTQLDQMTQQNAALVEQSAAAAHSMREQAAKLAEAVAVFKTGQSEARELIAQAQATAKAAPVTAARPAVRGSEAMPIVRPTAPAGDDWEEF